MDIISTLPRDVTFLLFYELDAPSASAFCSTSKWFKQFCAKREVRINTLINYYRTLPEGIDDQDSEDSQWSLFRSLVKNKDLTIKKNEMLESFLILHPDWATREMEGNEYEGPVYTFAATNLAAYTLLKYGALASINHEGIGTLIYARKIDILRLALRFGLVLGENVDNIAAVDDIATIDLLIRYGVNPSVFYTNGTIIGHNFNTLKIYWPVVFTALKGITPDYYRTNSVVVLYPYFLALVYAGMDLDPLINRGSGPDYLDILLTSIQASKERMRLSGLNEPRVRSMEQTAAYLIAAKNALNTKQSRHSLLRLDYGILKYLHTKTLMPYWDDSNFWREYISINQGKRGLSIPSGHELSNPREQYLADVLTPIIVINNRGYKLGYEQGIGFLTTRGLLRDDVVIQDFMILGETWSYEDSSMPLDLYLQSIYGVIYGKTGIIQQAIPSKEYTLKFKGSDGKLNTLEFDTPAFLEGALLLFNVTGAKNIYQQLTHWILD